MRKHDQGSDDQQVPNYDGEFVAALFDRMGPTYDLMNIVSSFGFSRLWRIQCVRNAVIRPGDVVYDFMSGAGECMRDIRRVQRSGRLVSLDFCPYMVERQRKKVSLRAGAGFELRQENALACGLPDGDADALVAAFAIKTLSPEQRRAFAREINRLLKPGGRFSLIEISSPPSRFLRAPFMFYIRKIIPVIGRLLVGDPDCYRMLGVYTVAFGDCASCIEAFRAAGLKVRMKRHFFGCATSLVGIKPIDTHA